MATIKPFQALIYNPQKIGDLNKVVCPPYDVISPQRQDYFHGLSPNNFIHILLGKDILGEDKYERARQHFEKWQGDSVFIRDAKPAIYFYSQDYVLRGEKRTRLGFISLLKLSDDSTGVFGHEHTRLEPKEDRLKLLRSVRANLSPIFSIFQDKKRIIQFIFKKYIGTRPPFADVTDDEKTRHKLWRLDSEEAIDLVRKALSKEDVFIADGHHRYEVACNYREELRVKLGSLTGEESCNYILSYFTNTDPRGLSILPTHRLVKLDPQFDWERFLGAMRSYFDIEEVKDKTRFLFLLEKGGRAEHVIGLYRGKKYRLLRLKNVKILDTILKDKSKAYRALDVSILNTLVFQDALKLDTQDKQRLSYNQDAEEIIRQADSEPNAAAFILNPVNMKQVIEVSLNKERMPAKSTYFYPKVLSGLVINKLE